MNRERAVLLLGKYGEALDALVRTPALGDRFVVTTPPDSDVGDLAAALQPTAVLLEASDFYLQGRELSRRLQERSRGSRILFFDVDRAWALWIEADPEGSQDLLIAPCELARAGEGLNHLLNGTGGFRRVAEFARIPLEPTG